MEFILIDYSNVYFEGMAKKSIPENRSGKFVLICSEDKEFLILSPQELSIYHANIVERFCSLRKIEGAFNLKRDHFKIFNSNWNVLGGGRWEIKGAKKVIRLFGASKAYGRFDSRGLKEKIRTVKGLVDFRVIVNPC